MLNKAHKFKYINTAQKKKEKADAFSFYILFLKLFCKDFATRDDKASDNIAEGYNNDS